MATATPVVAPKAPKAIPRSRPVKAVASSASGHAADSHKHELPPTLTTLAVSEADVTGIILVRIRLLANMAKQRN